MLPALHIVAVGKIKMPFWRDAAACYAQRLAHWHKILLTEIKDGDASLAADVRKTREGEKILAALNAQDFPICLDEHGTASTSEDFARRLQQFCNSGMIPCFILGGAYGLSQAVLAISKYTLAFGSLTLPHELARVVLLEQLYRAETILHKIPYHHA